MKKLIVQCDACGATDMSCTEYTFSFQKKAWAADICPGCIDEVTQWLTTWGMDGPQKRKLPGTPGTAKGTAAPAKKQAVKSNVKAKPDYKGKACLGCGRKFNTQQGRRTHNTRTGCA